MRRSIFLLTCLLLLGSCRTDSSPSVRIGVLLPYGSDTADYFRSMQLAVDELNAAGGVRGRPLELVLYDVMWDAEISYASFHQAVDDGAVAVLGGFSSALAQREAEAALERRVPLIGCCSSSDLLTTIQPPGPDHFFFRVIPPDRLQSVIIADRAYNRADLQCRNLGIVHMDDSYGNPLSASLAANFEALGGTVAASVSHAFFTIDFSTQVAAMAAANPDCIVLVSTIDDGRGFRKTWMDTGHPSVKWLASDAMFGAALGETFADPHLSDGIEVIFPWDLGTPSADAFVARFTARYGAPPTASALSSYDEAAALGLAIVAAESLDGDAIRDALVRVGNAPGTPIPAGDLEDAVTRIQRGEEIDYLGFTSTIEFDACGDVTSAYAILRLDANVPIGYTVVEAGLTASSVASPCP